MVRNKFSDFLSRIRIHIDQILWIRIRIRSMRIHITDSSNPNAYCTINLHIKILIKAYNSSCSRILMWIRTWNVDWMSYTNFYPSSDLWKILSLMVCCVVVYHVTIVAIGHGFLKKFWPMVIGCVLRTAGSSINWNYADPLTSFVYSESLHKKNKNPWTYNKGSFPYL